MYGDIGEVVAHEDRGPLRPISTYGASKLAGEALICAYCQLFDLREDPSEDHDLLADPLAAPVVDELMETHVRPFFRTPAVRPHPSPFAGLSG